MYGFVEDALIAYVQAMDNGEELWSKIRQTAGATHKSVNFHHAYSDEHTLGMIGAATKVLGISVEECLRQIGLFQVQVLVEKGYLPLVLSLGKNFYQLLCHLDHMHLNLVNAYPAMRGPSFKPLRQKDGSTILHYHSSRMGIAPYAIALLEDIAKKVFNLDIQVKHIQKKGDDADHDVFHLIMPPAAYGEKEYFDSVQEPAESSSLGLSPKMMDIVFPWHVAFGRDMNITSIGGSLARRLPPTAVGQRIFKHFRILRPELKGSSFLELATEYNHKGVVLEVLQAGDGDAGAQQQGCPFSAALRGNTGDATVDGEQQQCPHGKSGPSGGEDTPKSYLDRVKGEKASGKRASAVKSMVLENEQDLVEGIELLSGALYMKGELVYNEDSDTIMLLVNPTFSSVEEMHEQGIEIQDLPVHSSGRELIISTAHQSATVMMAQQLQHMTASLDTAMDDLDKEKKRVYDLLCSILPAQVAEALKTGNVPDPEHYEAVSILFSDIVSFTKISSSVPVNEVMDMLNELFSKFDALCEKHDVYKVETIGDAYMVASGLPTASPEHAEKLAAFAIDMVAAAETVVSPMDGEPLQIRVGMHSGKIMAGVVGRQRPRYCLFGDTVNVASRMESTGVGGAVQVSYGFIKALPNKDDWNILKRGNVKVKGKGDMKTFFVLGRVGSNMQLAPPDVDEYESEGQTPRFSLPASSYPGTDSASPRLSAVPFAQQQQPVVMSAQPARVASRVIAPVPDVMYQVLVHGGEKDIKLPFVPSSMTLDALMKDLDFHHTCEDGQPNNSSLRFFLDEFRESMLLPRMTLRELHANLVTNNVIKSTDLLELYVGDRLTLDHGLSTPRKALSNSHLSSIMAPATGEV